jgi:hypothetical protein
MFGLGYGERRDTYRRMAWNFTRSDLAELIEQPCSREPVPSLAA